MKNSANAEPGIKSAHNKLVALIIITNCSTKELDMTKQLN